LRHQTNAERSTNAVDCVEARFATGTQRLVKRFPGNAGVPCYAGHASCASNIAQRSSQQSPVIFFKHSCQISRYRLFAIQILSCVKIGQLGHFDDFGHVQSPNNFDNSMALLIKTS
jgi:hypothetical protein